MHPEALTEQGKFIFPRLANFPERMLSLLELAATKAYTIGRRGSYRDYIDLYFVIKEQHAGLQDIIHLAEQKYGSEFNGRLFLEQLLYLSDVEDVKINQLRGNLLDRNALEKFFEEKIRKMAF